MQGGSVEGVGPNSGVVLSCAWGFRLLGDFVEFGRPGGLVVGIFLQGLVA